MFEELEPKCDFEFNSSQPFATVIFNVYTKGFDVTIVKQDSVKQSNSDTKYERYVLSEGSSTCVYVREQDYPEKVIKICTIQHEGITSIQIMDVEKDELEAFDI